MLGVYVNWSQPFFKRDKLRGHGFKIFKDLQSSEYFKPDYEIYFTILSVMYWKKYNGPTKLYTDKVGLEYYTKIGIIDIWDEVDIDTLENFNELGIDGGIFWTSAKSYIISHHIGPFVFLDLDFIVRQKLPDWVFEKDVTIPYWEIPRGYYYPSYQELNSLSHWKPQNEFYYNMLVPNTSFIYLNNSQIQKEYWENHYQLVNTKAEVPEWVWLLSDQGLFGQALRTLKPKVETLSDKVFLSENEGYGIDGEGWAEMWYYKQNANKLKDNLSWEHVWLAKVVYTMDEKFKRRETLRYYTEIKTTFPNVL